MIISISKIKINSRDVITKQYSILSTNVKSFLNVEINAEDVDYFKSSISHYTSLVDSFMSAFAGAAMYVCNAE